MGTVAALAPARDRKAEALKKTDARQRLRAASRARLLAGTQFASAVEFVAKLWHELDEANKALAEAAAGCDVEVSEFDLLGGTLLREAVRAEFTRWGIPFAGKPLAQRDDIPAFADVLSWTDETIAISLRRAAGL